MSKEQLPAARRIRQIRIEKLFGYLDYTIPKFSSKETDRFLIFYGENGVGKTTILRLIYALLYPHPTQGQKSVISRSSFRKFELVLDDNTVVSAWRSGEKLVGDYTVSIHKPDGKIAEFSLVAEADLSITSGTNPITKEMFLALIEISPPMYFLPDDRKFTSSKEPPATASASAESMSAASMVRERYRRRESHHLAVSPVIHRLNTWINRKIAFASVAGEENTSSIYLRVIGEIAGVAGHFPVPEDLSPSKLTQGIKVLANEAEKFTRYGLATPVPVDRLHYFLEQAQQSPDASKTIARVLQPYISGIQARLNALEEVRRIVSTYVETINDFLVHKRIEFSPQKGFIFYSRDNAELKPNFLSSGERQLVVLLTNVVLAWETGGLFLIDEPELSLNVTWQRKLVGALLKCSSNSPIQFIMASHSLEMISQHLQNVAKLDVE